MGIPLFLFSRKQTKQGKSKLTQYGKLFDSETFSPHSIKFDLDKIRNKNYLTHDFHSYPAKFIPQFPHKVIVTLSSEGERVLDPFCGSGTTLVESKLLGRPSIGVDTNPIATLVSKVKTTILSEKQVKFIKEISSEIGQSINLHYGIKPMASERRKCIDFELPQFHNRDFWFKPFVLNELGIIKAHINLIQDVDVRDFLMVAFSSIIIKVSNQESDTRYAKKDKKIKEFDTFNIFSQKINNMLEKITKFSSRASDASVKIYTHDSRHMPFLEDETVHLIMTSPPYLNAYDYYLYHKLRMFWLGMNHYAVQELEIGSRNKHSDNDQGVDQYLASIRECLEEMHRTLKPNRYCCIVVGDGIKDNKLVKMDTAFQKLADNIGFVLSKKITYPLRKYTFSFNRGYKTMHKNGYLLIFKK